MTTPRYAVFGHPIAHSLSPRIHAAFGRQTGIALNYTAIDAPLETFAPSLANFTDANGRGANITQPLKQRAVGLCHAVSAFARRAGAVNTLTRVGTVWHGDNTDGPGLIRDLTARHGLDLRERRTLLLGAGGAAHAAAHALLDAGIGELVIVNRSTDRADALADSIRDPARVHTRYWHDLADIGSFDLIVNATSAGVARETLALPFGLIAPRALCYDLSYGAAALGFVAWARAAGAGAALDGLGMLVEQAAESFAIWHGTRPDTDPVHDLLRGELPLHATD
ncbi:MAG: shikimate dehydrogenase [Proteobacteria bacterium]|nr:shikimate dehydrogenase [Pseudomonadota bacterium]